MRPSSADAAKRGVAPAAQHAVDADDYVGDGDVAALGSGEGTHFGAVDALVEVKTGFMPFGNIDLVFQSIFKNIECRFGECAEERAG